MQPLPFSEPVALKRAVNWLGFPEHPFGIVDIPRLAWIIWPSHEFIVITSLPSFESGQALLLVVFCFLIFASYPQHFFPLFFSHEALFALSFPFLSERFFFVHAKAAQ